MKPIYFLVIFWCEIVALYIAFCRHRKGYIKKGSAAEFPKLFFTRPGLKK